MIWLLLLEPKDLFGLAGAVVGIASLFYAMFSKLSNEITELKERQSSTETKINLWWGIVEKQTAAVLIKPTHYERDLLIERYLRDELSEEELDGFIELMGEINADKNEKAGDRLAAANLGAFAQVKKELSKIEKDQPCESRFHRWMKRLLK